MYNIGTYEERVKDFNWGISEAELGYKDGDILNIGEYCSDRICRMGKADKLALIWEGHTNNIKEYTFDDMRVLTNTIANYLKGLGINAGERVCLFMDKIPELYFGFLGILKMGGIAQPLFSAFGGESLFTRLDDADTTAIITQKKHVGKVRKILGDLPHLKHIIIVDADGSKPIRERETAFHMEKEFRVENFEIFPSYAETPSVLHYTSGTTGKPKGAQHVHYSLISQYITAKYEPIKEPGTVGLIAIKPGWPSMFRSYWNNEEVYKSKFVNGWYICGDRASIDEDGYFWFVGRDDDVINTGGHLVGPFEVESALLEHEAVAESAVVGKPDPVNMEVVKAFITLRPGFESSKMLDLNIMNFIRKKLSPLAMPQEIEFVKSLPKTRSGKIMRRMLRAKEWGEDIGDTSTLEDDE